MSLPEGSSQFDLLCSHMRLDLREVRKVMPQNAVFITLLRDPIKTFESVFGYYTSTVQAFFTAHRAAAHEGKSALSVFLDSPEIFWDPKEPGTGLAKNPMSFWHGAQQPEVERLLAGGLGATGGSISPGDDRRALWRVPVLLGALLGLEHEDLAYLRLNLVPATAWRSWTRTCGRKMRSWNVLDTLLYDFFVQVFWEKAGSVWDGEVESGGGTAQGLYGGYTTEMWCPGLRFLGRAGRLAAPVADGDGHYRGYEVRGNLSLQDQGFCIRMMLPELQYHSHLYFKQYGRDMRAAPAEWNLGPVGLTTVSGLVLANGNPSTVHRASLVELN